MWENLSRFVACQILADLTNCGNIAIGQINKHLIRSYLLLSPKKLSFRFN
jgi:hypothetical protein